MTRVHPAPDSLRAAALRPEALPAIRRHAESCIACAREIQLVRALAAARRETDAWCPDAHELVRHADRRLGTERSVALRRHLATCLACTAEIESLERARPARGAFARVVVRDLVATLRALSLLEMPQSLALSARSTSSAGSRDLALAMGAYRRGQFETARADFERALDAGDASPECRFVLAACLRRDGRHDAAVTLLRDASRARPRLAEYRWHLAQALLSCGEAKEAMSELRVVTRLPGSRRAAARRLIARITAALDGL